MAKLKIGVCCLILLLLSEFAFGESTTFVDAFGKSVTITERPKRVVSLVPSVTEIIFKLGADNALKGMTYHSIYPSETSGTAIVGGFFEPSISAIEAINPDVIFISDIHKDVIEQFPGRDCILVSLNTSSIADSFDDIILLGKIFGKDDKAEKIVTAIKDDLNFISEKIKKISPEKRKRVIRLMGRDRILTPGSDSFQNEMIRAAGGMPHHFGRNGSIVEVSAEEWQRFNPQVIYGCGGDKKAAQTFFSTTGWKDVDAVKNGQIFYFPCDLTCRASTNTGYFVSWLAARIYPHEFSKKENLVLEEEIFNSSEIDIDLDYISDAKMVYSHIDDFENKTLVVNFKSAVSIVSTLEGYRDGIKTVGNHYSPPPCWSISHQRGLKGQRDHVYKVIGLSEKRSSFLFTGADMDNLSIQKKSYKDLTVYALVTAGVGSNAMRMSKDTGSYYEPGTINMLIMPNMKLSKRAMTRAVISATEAKTAALLDVDIRSSYTPNVYRATGTGTDNIIVVQGVANTMIDNAGGHSKLGELIGRSVYAGVKDAVLKQNRLTASRNIFQRLKERGITIYGLIGVEQCDCGRDKNDFVRDVEALLLDLRYAGFIETALALSDDYEKGLISDLTTYNIWTHEIAEEIAGGSIKDIKNIADVSDLPTVIGLAMNALLNGIYYREK